MEPPQRSPPSTGGTTPGRILPPTATPSLNGARPVRAGRLGLSWEEIFSFLYASTEPAQYGRDDGSRKTSLLACGNVARRERPCAK